MDSSSALDRIFELAGVSVPVGYQIAFAPVRAIYRVLGAERMASVEFIIDAVAVAANSGASFSALAPVAASALAGGAWLATRTRAVCQWTSEPKRDGHSPDAMSIHHALG